MTTICVISDTHENEAAIATAVAAMQPLKPEVVFHCGDIISPPVLLAFEGLPMRFVFGNNDGEHTGLRAAAQGLGFGEINDTLECEVAGKRIFCYHGTVPKILEQAIASQRHDYVFTGHTHLMRNDLVGKTRVVNPGALFAAATFTFAVIDLANAKVRFEKI